MNSREGPAADRTPTVPPEPPEIRPTRFSDFPQIHRLESEHFSELYTPDDRRRLFEDNPLWPRLRPTWPLGWVLEDSAGAIVGSVGNIPSRYVYRGEDKICANGHSWVTSAEHRAYAPMLMDEYFHQAGADLFVSSRVGPHAAPLWRAYGTPMCVGDWSRMAYVVTDRRAAARAALLASGFPFARTLSVPAAVALGVADRLASRPLPAAPHDVEVVENDTFDDRFDAFWEELRDRNRNTVLAVRDRPTLAWRFGIPLRAGRLWVHEAHRKGRMRAYCVVRAHYHRPAAAHRSSGLHRMRIVDYQSVDGSVDLLPGLLRAAALCCARNGYTMLEHNACEVPKMRSFDRAAPHRKAKETWSFYVRTTDPALTADLERPEVWDPSEYDGEPSYM